MHNEMGSEDYKRFGRKIFMQLFISARTSKKQMTCPTTLLANSQLVKNITCIFLVIWC